MQWKWSAYKWGRTYYAIRNSKQINGKRHIIYFHRVVNKTPDGFETDHINGDGLDNRKCNLRTATHAQNLQNKRPQTNGSSKYKGVSWHKQHHKWQSSIAINGVQLFLGYFDDEQEAAVQYEQKAKELFGEFARQ